MGDGLVVNRIPVRLRHWTELSLPFYLAYSMWTVLQSPLVFDVNNPDHEDDDKIYPILDWDASPKMAVVLVSMIVFVFSPIVHGILWGLSLPGRRYYADDVHPTVRNNGFGRIDEHEEEEEEVQRDFGLDFLPAHNV